MGWKDTKDQKGRRNEQADKKIAWSDRLSLVAKTMAVSSGNGLGKVSEISSHL
jgi:hypothetical protein